VNRLEDGANDGCHTGVDEGCEEARKASQKNVKVFEAGVIRRKYNYYNAKVSSQYEKSITPQNICYCCCWSLKSC
jgi:hypothetical protein